MKATIRTTTETAAISGTQAPKCPVCGAELRLKSIALGTNAIDGHLPTLVVDVTGYCGFCNGQTVYSINAAEPCSPPDPEPREPKNCERKTTAPNMEELLRKRKTKDENADDRWCQSGVKMKVKELAIVLAKYYPLWYHKDSNLKIAAYSCKKNLRLQVLKMRCDAPTEAGFVIEPCPDIKTALINHATQVYVRPWRRKWSEWVSTKQLRYALYYGNDEEADVNDSTTETEHGTTG